MPSPSLQVHSLPLSPFSSWERWAISESVAMRLDTVTKTAENCEPVAELWPYKFGLTHFIQADAYAEAQYANCEAARAESQKLIGRLFNEQVLLRQALNGGLAPHFNELMVNCFDAAGRFDHVVCSLLLNTLGPSRFLVQLEFYGGDQLVARTYQKGRLIKQGVNTQSRNRNT